MQEQLQQTVEPSCSAILMICHMVADVNGEVLVLSSILPMASATLTRHVSQGLRVIRKHNIPITCIYIDASMALMLSKAVIDLQSVFQKAAWPATRRMDTLSTLISTCTLVRPYLYTTLSRV